MANLKIPQGGLGTRLSKEEKKKISNVNAHIRGSIEQDLGRVKKL